MCFLLSWSTLDRSPDELDGELLTRTKRPAITLSIRGQKKSLLQSRDTVELITYILARCLQEDQEVRFIQKEWERGLEG